MNTRKWATPGELSSLAPPKKVTKKAVVRKKAPPKKTTSTAEVETATPGESSREYNYNLSRRERFQLNQLLQVVGPAFLRSGWKRQVIADWCTTMMQFITGREAVKVTVSSLNSALKDVCNPSQVEGATEIEALLADYDIEQVRKIAELIKAGN